MILQEWGVVKTTEKITGKRRNDGMADKITFTIGEGDREWKITLDWTDMEIEEEIKKIEGIKAVYNETKEGE